MFGRKSVSTKKILRFYFSAESLNKAFDSLIISRACAPETDGLDAAEKLCSLIGDKMRLERLWGYLDNILSGLSEEERVTLSKYSARCAALKSNDREVKRAVIKFTRRARRLDELDEEISVLNDYYCLIKG